MRQGGMEGGRGQARAARWSLTDEWETRQQGQRAVDPAQEGHQRRAVPGVLQADQPRLRGAAGLEPQPRGGQHRVHAAAVHSVARALRPVEPRTRPPASSCTSSASSSWTTPRRCCPRYLRFVKGVIDSADLPLNVSRELLQESRDVKAIREGSTKRVLAMLEDLAKAREGRSAPSRGGQGQVREVLRRVRRRAQGRPGRGLRQPRAPRQAAALCLDQPATRASVSLADYKARMKEGQEAIYYITADTLAAAEEQPAARSVPQEGHRGAADDRSRRRMGAELPATSSTARRCSRVAKGAVDLGKLQDEAEKKAAEEAAEAFKPVLEKLKEALKDKAQDVRVTTRLVDSPACLVVQRRRHEHAARAHAQAGRPEGARGQAGAGSQRRPSAGEEARRLARTSTTWRTSCSTRRCWPRAACRTTRRPTCGASTRCWCESERGNGPRHRAAHRARCPHRPRGGLPDGRRQRLGRHRLHAPVGQRAGRARRAT